MTSNGGTFQCQICQQNIDLIGFPTHLTRCIHYQQRGIPLCKQTKYISSKKLKDDAVSRIQKHSTHSGQFLDVNDMFFDIHNVGDVSFEVVQNTDIEMATYTENAQKSAAADPDNLLHIPPRRKKQRITITDETVLMKSKKSGIYTNEIEGQMSETILSLTSNIKNNKPKFKKMIV